LVLLGFLAESRAGRGSLDTKIDRLGSDLRSDIGRLDARIDVQGTSLGARIDGQTARIDHLSERVEEHLRAHA